MMETREWPRPFVRRLVWPYGLLALALLLVLGGLATYFRPAWLENGKDTEEKDNAADSLASNQPNRVIPTDMSKVEPVIDDDFGGSVKLPFFPPGEDVERFFQKFGETTRLQNRRLVLTMDRRPPPPFNSCSPAVRCTDFVCEVRGRTTGQGDAGWAIYHDDDGDWTLWVMVRMDGAVEWRKRQDRGDGVSAQAGILPVSLEGPRGRLHDLASSAAAKSSSCSLTAKPWESRSAWSEATTPGINTSPSGAGEPRKRRPKFTHYTLWCLP